MIKVGVNVNLGYISSFRVDTMNITSTKVGVNLSCRVSTMHNSNRTNSTTISSMNTTGCSINATHSTKMSGVYIDSTIFTTKSGVSRVITLCRGYTPSYRCYPYLKCYGWG